MKKKSVKFNTGFTPTPTFRKQHSCASTTHSESGCRGFTLIELLVVVAIIGILSTIVISSLNSARERGKIASIKSTLKQLYNQAALNQLESGSFTGSNTNDYDLTCTGLTPDGSAGNSTTGNLAKIAQPLINQGVLVKCFSYNGANGIYLGDNNLRFGATALIYDTTELKAWSVDENGVVKWDTHGVNSDGTTRPDDTTLYWRDTNGDTIAMNACSKNGGRLPSLEQARTLSYAWYQGSENSVYTPFGFSSSFYWSSTRVPSNTTGLAYLQGMNNGSLVGYDQVSVSYVRCVR